MADVISVHPATALVHSGKTQLIGLVITASVANAKFTIDDSIGGGGTKILEGFVSTPQPLVLFFSDQHSPRFATGLYLTLAANMEAILWTRQL